MKNKVLLFISLLMLTCSSFGYRDLETGTFLTRDPIGYGDGPNVYCYVHCNPITHFDPLGLKVSSTTTKNKDGTTQTDYEIEAEVVFEDERLNDKNDDGTYTYQDERDDYIIGIMDGILDTYNGNEGNHTWSLSQNNLTINIATSAKDVKENSHMIIVTSADKMPGGSEQVAVAERGGGAMWLNTSAFSQRRVGHESAHWFGLADCAPGGYSNVPDNMGVNGNITIQSWMAGGKSTELTYNLVREIDKFGKVDGGLNNGLGPRKQTAKLRSDRDYDMNVNKLEKVQRRH